MYNGTEFSEIDVDAIIKRKPKIVLIDELAHTNVQGSKNIKRYEDVEEILAHGISVITTLNIEHIESLNLEIRRITGVKISETIPDSIIDNADEVVVIDISPTELQKRLKNGTIYADGSASNAIKNFFRINSLNALRELSLRLTAEGVDEKLAIYMREHGIHDNWHTVERVMVCITSNINGKRLIKKGVKIASRFKCECYVVNVNHTSIFSRKPNLINREMLISHRKLAKKLGAEIVTLESKSVFKALSNFAIEKHITQIVIGSSRKTKSQYFFTGSTLTKLVRYTKNVEFHIVPSD
jgi:two-component system sensor histidine kinase KdpD